MKKIFSLFAAVLMAGSMLADDATLIKFSEVQAATAVAGSTYGSEGFTLVIPATSDKATVDENNCTFGVSAEETVSFTHRLKTGGASTKDGRIFTLNIPEEGPLAIYARTSSKDATDRSFVIANGSDVIVDHICLDTDTVEGASSKIFLPVIVENVPAGSYTITYNNGINFYGFQMVVEETETTHVSELLYEMTTDEAQGSNNSYTGNCDIEMGAVVWNFTGNSQMNPWRIGGKSLAAVEREVYTKTAYPAELDSVCLYLGLNSLTSLDGVKLVYSTNADFSDAEEVIAAVPEAFPATVTFAVEGGFPAKAYYKFVFTCTVSGSQNKYIQFNGVDFWGVMPVVAVTDPVFSVAAGSYYEAQTVELSCETEGAEIRYTLDGTEPTAASALYAEALTISETTTVKAIAIKGADQSDVVEKTYTIATVYNSFDELVNQAGAPAGQKVVVNFSNVVIDSLYVSSKGKVNGVYLTAAGRMVEIYCYDVPAEWEVGGTISGTVKGEWKEYLGTWEVCPDSWNGITYQAPVVTINYWLVGPAAENGWDQTNAMPMPGDSIVRHLNAGTYEFKVLVAEGSWTGALGYANLDTVASSANVFGSDNVVFELENEGDVIIKVVESKIVVLGTFKKQESYDYYIKFAGNGWTWVGMTQAPSGVYMYEGVWGGTGANVNTQNNNSGSVWYPEANIFFGTEEMDTLPVPAVGTVGYYVYIPDAEPAPMLAFLYEGTPAGWDGTVTLSKDTFTSIADLEGITLTFNGATSVEFLGGDADIIALQNEDGRDIYAAWHPELGGSYTIEGNVVTLTGWFTVGAPLPEQNATLYVEDYGAFKIDGVADYFETVEVAFETAGPTTYTVTYTVNGFDVEHCIAQAGYFNDSEEGDSFVAGANTVPENMSAFVYVMTVDGYTVEVKVNGEAVTLADGYWDGAINADMTIDVTFTAPGETNPWASVYTTNVEFTAGTNSYLSDKINIDGTEYDAFKIGTSKNTGNCTITLPAGTEHLYIHATGWSLSETTTMTVSGAGLNVTETLAYYLNISGNSPYTVAADRDASKAFFAYDFATPLAAETTVTLSGNARVVFFGVNVEGNFTPTALENVKAEKAVKVLENGKVVIIKNGVKYNVMGQKF